MAAAVDTAAGGSQPPSAIDAPTGASIHVLLVDGDAVARRFAQQAFESTDIVLEMALDGQQALELIDREPFDLVMAENALADMTGVQLLWRLRQQQRTATLPFLFWTSDGKPEARIDAYNAGAELLSKPTTAAEMLARARSLVLRQRRELELRRLRPYLLAGHFEALPLPDLVSMLAVSRRSGTLSILAAGRPGRLVFREGQVVRAELGNLFGVGAFFRAVAAAEGQFEFDAVAPDELPDPDVAAISTTHLLLEAARCLDTAGRDVAGRAISTDDLLGSISEFSEKTPIDPRIGELVKTSGAPRGVPRDRVPDTRPSPSFARAAAGVIQTPMTLAELQLLPLSEIGAWSRSSPTLERALIVVTGDIDFIVSHMAAACTPPSEQILMASLSREDKFVAMRYIMRGSRTVDVLALEQARLEALDAVLERRPSIVLILARNGDSLTVGTHARVKLGFALSRIQPRMVVALGDETIPKLLVEIRALSRSPIITHWLHGALGAAGYDLRRALAEAMLVWGRSEPGTPASPWDVG